MYLSIICLLVSTTVVLGDVSICRNNTYQANTLKTLREQVIAYSFVDTSK
jgi:hypothetical protein